MADATARRTKRQRLVEEFEHQGAEGRRTLETISCSICAEPFDDPVSLRDSGHTYCRVCITQALANHARCPLSNAPIAVPRGGVDSVLVPNHQFRTLIDSQRVACRYASCGCAARPEVGAADAHEASCPHAPLKCSRCPFLGSRAETEAHEQSCPYVVLGPVLDAQASRIQSLERRVFNQDLTNERLIARLDALERSARTVTPASARRPSREAPDLVFAKTRNDAELSMGGKMASCDVDGSGCAISSETLRSGTHSWEIRLHRTDGAAGIGVCTKRDGFCLDIGDGRWYRGVMSGGMWVTNHRNEVADADSDVDAPWCADSGWCGRSLVVKFDCGTGKLSVRPKDGILESVSHVFGELASTPVAPFVFLTSRNTCEIASYVCSPPRAAPVDPADLLAPVPEPMDSDEEAAQAVADFVRQNKERRRSRLDDVSFDDNGETRESAGARASDRRRAVAAQERAVERWAGAQPDSDGSPPRRRARRVRVGAPARRSPNFSSGGGDAADAIDVDDEPILQTVRRPVRRALPGQRRAPPPPSSSSSSDDEQPIARPPRRRDLPRRNR